METKIKIKKGDRVKVIAGKDKGKEGKILIVDRKKNRVIVEGVNMLTKHIKAGKSRENQQGGIIHVEGSIHASNVMYLHKGKPTKIGIKEVVAERGGRKKINRIRIAKTTGETID